MASKNKNHPSNPLFFGSFGCDEDGCAGVGGKDEWGRMKDEKRNESIDNVFFYL